VSDRREQPDQLDIETALVEQEEGFAGWSIFQPDVENDEEEPAV
jgi:hypothetical protein